jgi:hypothetical protein
MFGAFRKAVSFSALTYVPLSVIYGLECTFVRPAFKEAVESLDAGPLQFFPYECRLKTGEVFEKLYLMHWSKRFPYPIDHDRSGYPSFNSSLHREKIIRNGQVVIKRSLLFDRPMQICGSLIDTVYSKQLVDKLREDLGKNEDFYPVHVYEDA